MFSARGAFMQIGALIGTIMAANVLMVIIPGQRKVVADLIAGRTPDPVARPARQAALDAQQLPDAAGRVRDDLEPLPAGLRDALQLGRSWRSSLVMGAVIRHFYNMRHQGLPSPWWTWGVAVACAGSAIVWLSTLGPAQSERQRAKRAEAPLPTPSSSRRSRTSSSAAAACATPRAGVARASPSRPRACCSTRRPASAHAREIAVTAAWSSAMPPSNVTDLTAGGAPAAFRLDRRRCAAMMRRRIA